MYFEEMINDKVSNIDTLNEAALPFQLACIFIGGIAGAGLGVAITKFKEKKNRKKFYDNNRKSFYNNYDVIKKNLKEYREKYPQIDEFGKDLSMREVDAKSVLQHAPATYNNKKPDLYRFIVYYKGEHTEDNMAILIMYDFNKRQTIVSTNKSMNIPEEAIIYFVAKATAKKIEIYDGYIDYIVEECTKDDRNQNAVVYRNRSNPIYKQ